MKTRSILLIMLTTALLTAPVAARAAGDVTATLMYPAGTVLPAGSVVQAEVLDEFAADAPNVIAHTEVPAQPPTQKVVLKIDAAKIQGNHPYTLVLSVKSGGQFVLYAPQKHPVLTMGHGGSAAVGLAVVPIQPENKPYGPAFEETYWKLISVAGVPAAAGSMKEPFIRLNAFSHTVSGTGGCNNFVGGYEAAGQSVSFKSVGTTRMACPAGTNSDDALLKALQASRKWQITDDRMNLVDDAGTVLASFQGVPPQPAIGAK